MATSNAGAPRGNAENLLQKDIMGTTETINGPYDSIDGRLGFKCAKNANSRLPNSREVNSSFKSDENARPKNTDVLAP